KGVTILTNNNNNYSGGTLVSGTTLQLKANNAAGTGAITLDDAVFQAGAANLKIANNFQINNTPDGSAIDSNGRVLTLSGNISDGNGPGALTFINTGALGNSHTILLGANSYTGGTVICSCAGVQLGDNTHQASLVGQVTNEGQFAIMNADTSGI